MAFSLKFELGTSNNQQMLPNGFFIGFGKNETIHWYQWINSLNSFSVYVLDLLVYVSLVVKFLPANLLAIYIYIYSKCSLFNVYSTCKKWKRNVATVFKITRRKAISRKVATLKQGRTYGKWSTLGGSPIHRNPVGDDV